MKEEYKEPPKLKNDLDWLTKVPELPTNYDLEMKRQEELTTKTPEQIEYEKQDKIFVSWNWKF